MNNLVLYGKVIALKNYLEIHEAQEVSKDNLTQAICKINEVFTLLERRKGERKVSK